eukprot:TRINITY_DN19346_c0_g1_i2.p1 TRINITY_DN19346_c0_g1~~TRINITY_DN19346_c0_g1_i2.p1  ORF type:complete len:585 (-),score=67.91 TRINITY_DN19346_c0_g1_i2:170-1873(-)
MLGIPNLLSRKSSMQLTHPFPTFVFILLFQTVGLVAGTFSSEALRIYDTRLQEAVSARQSALQQAFAGANPKERKSACSCYGVRHGFGHRQSLCIFDNLCFNGSHMVAAGDPSTLTCREPSDVLETGPVLAISCEAKKRWEAAVKQVEVENLNGSVVLQDQKWLTSRDPVWRLGLTYFTTLSRSCRELGHFIGKAMSLLLVNNCTLKAFQTPVEHIALPRHHEFLLTMRNEGSVGTRAMLLSILVQEAMRGLFGTDVRRSQSFRAHRLLGTKPMADGLLEFEGAFQAASDEKPLCFQRVMLPGTLRGISYVGGLEVKDYFVDRLKADFHLPRDPVFVEGRVRLAYIGRKPNVADDKRLLTPGSAKALSTLLASLDVEVRRLDLENTTFRDQLVAVQETEIFIALHGSALVVPTTFGRPETVIIELMPFHMFQDTYYHKAISTGMTFMMHQCRRGIPQPGDDMFSNTTLKQCAHWRECKLHYSHGRPVQLTREDLEDLETLLKLAKSFVLRARTGLYAAGTSLRRAYSRLCIERRIVANCRQTFLHSSPADPFNECVLSRDCTKGVSP